MRLLLDTHVVLWGLRQDDALGQRATAAIEDPENEVFVSAVSVWEIAIKKASGKLTAPDNLRSWIGASGFQELPVTFAHAEQAGALPLRHRDPFDRMLIAQAQAEGLVLVTADGDIPRYGIRMLPATR